MDDTIRLELIDVMMDASSHKPDRSTLEKLLDEGEERFYPAGCAFIKEGLVCSNLFLMGKGIYRNGYRDTDREVTYGFGSMGSMFMSPCGFWANEKSVYFFEAVVDSVAIVWQKSFIDDFLASSHDFSRWLLGICFNQFYILENKMSYMRGTAKERYDALFNKEWNQSLKNYGHHRRPEIMNMVSSKVLASYLGITPSYLSYLRNPRGGDESAPKKQRTLKTMNGTENRRTAPKQYEKLEERKTSLREAKKLIVLTMIKDKPTITIAEIVKATGFGLRTVKTYISELKKDGLLRHSGSLRAGIWIIGNAQPIGNSDDAEA